MGFLSLFVRLIHVFSFPASVVPSWRVGLFWKKYFFEFLIRVRSFTRSRNLLVGFLIWLNQLTFKSCICKLCARTFLTVFLMSNICTTSTSKFYCLFQSLEGRMRGSWDTFSHLILKAKIIQRGASEKARKSESQAGERGREGRTTAWLEMMLIG